MLWDPGGGESPGWVQCFCDKAPGAVPDTEDTLAAARQGLDPHPEEEEGEDGRPSRDRAKSHREEKQGDGGHPGEAGPSQGLPRTLGQ